MTQKEAVNRSRIASLGVVGMATLVLALGAAALLAATAAGTLDQGWEPMVAAAGGIVAGLLGCLGLLRRPATHASHPARPPDATTNSIAALLRNMAEEMVRLKRDGAETSRSLADARQASVRVIDAAGSAIARLDESAQSSAIAARALSMLPGIADTQARRIELMAERAEDALAILPGATARAGVTQQALREEVLAALRDGLAQHQPEPIAGLEEALARLDGLPGDVSVAMNASLAERQSIEAAALEGAIAQLEAARPDPMLAQGLAEATDRLDGLAGQFERGLAAASAEASPPPNPAEVAEQLHAILAPSLGEALSRRLMALAEAVSNKNAAGAEAQAGLAELDARLMTLSATLPEAVQGGVTAAWAASAERFEGRFNAFMAEIPQSLLAGCEARIASLADRLDSAAAIFPDAAKGLQSHLAALEMLGPLLNGVTERLAETADALARAAGEAAAIGTAAAAPRNQALPDAAPMPTAPEQPSPGQKGSVATQAPELLNSLNETIRGLQSISTAIAVAAGRDQGQDRAA